MTLLNGYTIRKLRKKNYLAWKYLWHGYLACYDTIVDDFIYRSTFERLVSKKNFSQHAKVAECDGKFIGLARYIFHPHNWKIEDVCYLQDLYVLPNVRRNGAGRSLIDSVYQALDARNVSTVYWLTRDFNEQARKLYDKLAQLTPFIKYNRF